MSILAQITVVECDGCKRLTTLTNDVERETFDQTWLRTRKRIFASYAASSSIKPTKRRSLVSFQRWSVSTEQRRLFPMVETGFLEFPCTICDDLGLWQTPKGDVQPCPVIARGDRHRDPNPAALSVDRAVDELKRTQFRIDSRLFAMAKMLTGFSSAKPCERDKILVNVF
jgi:hypothetical protein